MSDSRKKINLILLFSFSLLAVFWMASKENSFCFDDISLLLTVSTSSYEEIFHFLPRSAYADRPVGVLFIKYLYESFGLDYGCFHVVLILLHLCNVYFVFLIVKHLFARKYEEEQTCFYGGIVAAAFFGMWAKTQMAVQWTAAIYDLLGTFFSLLSLIFYLRYRREKVYKGQNFVFTLLFYYLAIRTKEMFLILPFLFVVYEMWEMFLTKERRHFTKSIPISLLVFALFFGRILYCKIQGSMTNDRNNPYYQSMNPIHMLQNLLKYSMMCFDLEHAGWGYVFSITGLLGTILIAAGFCAAVWKAVVHRKTELLFCYIAAGISIVIVLPMVNQVHILYLYFPAVFLGLLVACAANRLHCCCDTSILLMCLFLASGASTSAVQTRNYWLRNAGMEKAAWEDIEQIKPPAEGATIYIRNLDGMDYTPFFYGEGGICKLLYQDLSLNVQVLENGQDVELCVPYVLWNYQNGRVTEIERKE